MPTVVGVRLRHTPKTLFFDPVGADPQAGQSVVVETERGTEFGEVVEAAHDIAESALPAPLKPIMRIATDDDVAKAADLAEKEAEAMPAFRQAIEGSGLDMKPVDVEYLFGGDKIVFYFAAEDRVDFRDLVKELASQFKARIDMRQVGVRDEARMVGGIGHCGEQLCCCRFGSDFQPVSIRMAKEQDLPLNPLKISGLCGRLMCCLRYEYDAYKDFKGRAPKRGAMIETPAGPAKVSDLNTPRELVTMRVEGGDTVTVPLASMSCSKGGSCPCSVSAEEFAAATGANQATAVVIEREPDLSVGDASELPASAPAEREGGPRRRRRRGRGGSGGGGQQAQAAEASAKPAAPAPAAGGEAVASSGGGRKRRRRRGRGGGGGSAGGSAEGTTSE